MCVCSAVMVTDLGSQPKGYRLNPGMGLIHEPEIYRDPVSIVLLSGALNLELLQRDVCAMMLLYVPSDESIC